MGGDILGIWTDEGWLYVATLVDTFSRRVVGLAMSAVCDEPLVEAALRMALGQRVPEGALIRHTDRGSQFTTDDYLALLKAYGVCVSMSGKGDPYDNDMAESFFSPCAPSVLSCSALRRAGQHDWLSLSTSWNSTIVSGFIRLWVIVHPLVLKPPIHSESLPRSALLQSGSTSPCRFS